MESFNFWPAAITCSDCALKLRVRLLDSFPRILSEPGLANVDSEVATGRRFGFQTGLRLLEEGSLHSGQRQAPFPRKFKELVRS